MLRLLTGFAAFAAVVAVPFAAQSSSSAPPLGFDGHILDGTSLRTCTQCHNSFALNSGTGAVEIVAPATVAPGQTVPITIRVVNTTPTTGTRRQGFLASVRTHAEPLPSGQGAFAGTITRTDPVNTGPANGDSQGAYVGHTSAGTAQTAWTFDWTAPATPGPATIYAAGNAANGGDGPLGDYIYTARATVTVAAASAGEAPPAEAAVTLGAPAPHPVRTAAALRLTLPAPATVTATVVDGRGRTVRTLDGGAWAAGPHAVRVRADGLAPGTYFVVVEADGVRRTQPFVVAR